MSPFFLINTSFITESTSFKNMSSIFQHAFIIINLSVLVSSKYADLHSDFKCQPIHRQKMHHIAVLLNHFSTYDNHIRYHMKDINFSSINMFRLVSSCKCLHPAWYQKYNTLEMLDRYNLLLDIIERDQSTRRLIPVDMKSRLLDNLQVCTLHLRYRMLRKFYPFLPF